MPLTDGAELSLGVMLFLAAISFATSMLSAIVGMAGGIVLLACMLLFLDPLVAIPIHGLIQLVSNGSRAFIQRRHVRWDITWRYSAFLVPGAWIGLQIALEVPRTLMRALIGVFVMVATWVPRHKPASSSTSSPPGLRRFVILGGVAGMLNMLVGAVGPLIAPFFLSLGLARQEIVGTKAMCQTIGHLVKLMLFGVAGFAFLAYLHLYALMIPMVLLGTWVGSRILDRVSEQLFIWIYKIALSGIAIFLMIEAIELP